MKAESKKAVIILSGGLDSTTCMGYAQERGCELYPLTYDYGQRHRIEIEKSQDVAKYYGVEARQRIIHLGFMRELGGSALTDDSIRVPIAGHSAEGTQNHLAADAGRQGDRFVHAQPPGNVGETAQQADPNIPATYVPGRNLLFLSIAASYAEVIGAEAIYIGVNALDYSGYPDCRPEFIHKFEEIMALATKAGVEGKRIEIYTPLMHLSKADIIREGIRMKVPYELTTSCYNGKEAACGECDSCALRLKGFAEAGMEDPIAYRHIP